MALSKDQIMRLKQGQRQAGVADDEYRETLQRLCGVASSKDPAMGDSQWDQMVNYFEAIYWRGVDAGTRPAPGPRHMFREPGYWARKNSAASNSRDRFAAGELMREIDGLEFQIRARGKGDAYLATIRDRVCGGLPRTVAEMRAYAAALGRTLRYRPRETGFFKKRETFFGGRKIVG